MAKKSIHGLSPEQVDRIFSFGTDRESKLPKECSGDPETSSDGVSSPAIANNINQQNLRGFVAGKTVSQPGMIEQSGQSIGPYKLLEKIGEGGFGVVFAARQQSPFVRRVAVKIIKPGMDSKQVIGRFEAERQALAIMDHPGIAKVFDAGATESGHPYFVMELVKGIPITQCCDQQKLSIQERLDLFVSVCNAIQHAHQKGIIHRDLKPSNILVTLHDGELVPKVIDFGIAKATQQELTDKTIYTHIQEFIGTPAYMSPEQAEMSGLDIDTRSDIYSLGVLLYELLTGKTPLDNQKLLSAGPDEARRKILEEEPCRPSTRMGTMVDEELTAISRLRKIDPPKLRNLLRGDLDWIVMTCLEKDRTRRYETANALATDLKRHLENRPVAARPPSTMYRLQKAWRRHKTVYVAGVAVLIALITGLSFAALGWHQAWKQREEAVQARIGEETQRLQAEAQELAARKRAYSSDMNLAIQALRGNNLGRAQDLLNRQRPRLGESDLRGWEWRYLWQQTRSDALLTLCQKSEIESLAISSDGRWLAIGVVHNDGIFIWDLRTRQEVAHLM
ncbi:MAG: serine/threonine protein kinase, partial [Planctomycetota bacterium]